MAAHLKGWLLTIEAVEAENSFEKMPSGSRFSGKLTSFVFAAMYFHCFYWVIFT